MRFLKENYNDKYVIVYEKNGKQWFWIGVLNLGDAKLYYKAEAEKELAKLIDKHKQEIKRIQNIIAKKGESRIHRHFIEDCQEFIDTAKIKKVNAGEDYKEEPDFYDSDYNIDLDEALGLNKVNESLKGNEIDDFFKRAKELGVTTLGELKRLMDEPEFFNKDDSKKPESQGMEDFRNTLGKDFKIKESLNLGKLQGIKILGYYNTWSAIDSLTVSIEGKEPTTYYLMENDEYRDETFYLVVTEDLKTIYETFDNIETCLKDELDTDRIEIVNEKLIQGKSEQTLKKNIATEIEAGKDPKQAVAIAKSIQKKNEGLKEEVVPTEKEIDTDISDEELAELKTLADNVIKENKKGEAPIKEDTSIEEINKEIEEEDEAPVIDYVNPNITTSPGQIKEVDLNK